MRLPNIELHKHDKINFVRFEFEISVYAQTVLIILAGNWL